MTLDRLDRIAHGWRANATAALLFAGVNAAGYALGGIAFVTAWGGSLAAVIATAFLVFKAQGYWIWMMVNAALWLTLFFQLGLPILAWLQVSFLVFALYGLVQWALVRWRVGYDRRAPTDAVGSALALGLVAYSLWAYRGMPNVGSVWWTLEVGTVLLAIAAMWADAFRYRANWYAWTLSNVLAWPLFWHAGLLGPFVATFVYQAINVVGWYRWTTA